MQGQNSKYKPAFRVDYIRDREQFRTQLMTVCLKCGTHGHHWILSFFAFARPLQQPSSMAACGSFYTQFCLLQLKSCNCWVETGRLMCPLNSILILCLQKLLVSFAQRFESFSFSAVKHSPVSFPAFGSVWAESLHMTLKLVFSFPEVTNACNSLLFLLMSLGQLVWAHSNYQKQFVQTIMWPASPLALMAPQASDSADRQDQPIGRNQQSPCDAMKGDSKLGWVWY